MTSRFVGDEKGGPIEMMVAGFDIHKQVLQAAMLDLRTGELVHERSAASVIELEAWAARWQGRVHVIAVEATTGWRWVCRTLQTRGFDVRLADPGEARALRGAKRRAKTDRLDARWLTLLLAKQMLPEAWIPPAEIQWLRDRTRLRMALVQDRTSWAQRLHAFLQHEGWPIAWARLLTDQGKRWVLALSLTPAARAHVEAILHVLTVLEHEIQTVALELGRFARHDPRTRALTRLRGIGPVLACILLAEIGGVRRFRRARQITRAAALDPAVLDSADSTRRGRLAQAGSPQLRFALVEAATWAGRPGSPDRDLYLTVARKIGRRAYHVLRNLEQAA